MRARSIRNKPHNLLCYSPLNGYIGIKKINANEMLLPMSNILYLPDNRKTSSN